MNEKKQYCGLDLLKFIMAVLVAARHMIRYFIRQRAAGVW